jgi:hypothetical protein
MKTAQKTDTQESRDFILLNNLTRSFFMMDSTIMRSSIHLLVRILIQCDQKVSVHLMNTGHRYFLIALYLLIHSFVYSYITGGLKIFSLLFS